MFHSFLCVFIASFNRQLKEFLRYPNLLLKIFFFTPFAIILPYYFTLKMFSKSGGVMDNNYVYVLLLGALVWNFIYFSVIETCTIADRELNFGTLENVYVTPFYRQGWVLGLTLVPVVLFVVTLIAIGALVYFILGSSLSVNILSLSFTLLITFIFCWELCVLTFIANIYHKRLFNIINAALGLCSIFVGVFYNIDKLPNVLKWVGYMLPPSHCIMLIRNSFNGSLSGGLMGIQTGYLMGTIVVLIPVIVLLNKQFERRMRFEGSLGKY